ncbi:hypothetical protein PybrP1_011058 [[Pythium] brassicae (nom. inval.)]|nr:hypothetical protein PybrP1_011058 [[Pythium] brassicae (nom. inval.)]
MSRRYQEEEKADAETDNVERDGDNTRVGVTAFNMEDEKDDGHFDSDGNFVWRRDERRVQEDAWLDGVSDDQIGAARQAKDRREFWDEQSASDTLTTEHANAMLASLLLPRETVLKALQRLGSKRSKSRGAKRKLVNGDAPSAQTAEEKAQFEQVTEAADFLMRQGEVDVYSQIREEFVDEDELLAERRAAGRVSFAEEESKNEEQPPPPQPEVLWEYRGADGEIHGPFPSSSFVAWQQQGYFTGDSAVDIRQVASARAQPDGDESKEPEQVKEPEALKPEPEKISAEQELLNDFEDSEDEGVDAEAAGDGDKVQQPDVQAAGGWSRSDQVDFSSY